MKSCAPVGLPYHPSKTYVYDSIDLFILGSLIERHLFIEEPPELLTGITMDEWRPAVHETGNIEKLFRECGVK